jgi:transcriptional regulator with XRE-family HTH domain
MNRSHAVTGAQIRAARAFLKISAKELATATKLSRNTVLRAEDDDAQVTEANAARLVELLQAKGITFLPADNQGLGIRYLSQGGEQEV